MTESMMFFLLKVTLLVSLVGNLHGLSKDQVFGDCCNQWRSKVLKTFTTSDLQKVPLPADYAAAQGSINKKDAVQYDCDAYQSSQLSYLRILRFEGAGFNVFNCVALPKLIYDLPILGIDIVSLPGGNLCSIDFQPAVTDLQYFTKPIYSAAKTRLSKWSRVLPPGGDFMPAAAKCFSPQAVWTRFPHSDGNSLFFLITLALDDYLELYSDHLKNSPECLDPIKIEQRRAGIKDYLTFRTVNDPAKNILNKAFGETWTHSALTEVVFPLNVVV